MAETILTVDVDMYRTYGRYTPCHQLKTPRDHQWSLRITRGCDCGCYDNDAEYICSRCHWGFDAKRLARILPVGNSLFE